MLPALILTVLLALLAVFQLALAAGAPWGRLAWGGQSVVLPRRLRIGSILSVVIYAVIAVVELDRAGVIDLLPDVIARVTLVLAVLSFLVAIA